jgi:hypothetical protein
MHSKNICFYSIKIMKTIKIPAMFITVNDVIIIHDIICRVTSINNSRATRSQGEPKCHITGWGIIDDIPCETLCYRTDIFDKLIPFTCIMKIISVYCHADNFVYVCSLLYRNEVIQNVKLPKTRNNIRKRYDNGESIKLKVDNYLDSYYVIRNNPRE